MSTKIKFENSLTIMRFILLISGLKTYKKKYNKYIEKFVNSYLSYINFIILYIVILGEITWFIKGVKDGKNFVELSLNLPLMAISIFGTFKFYQLYAKRDIVVLTLNALEEIHPEELGNEKSYNDDSVIFIPDIKIKDMLRGENGEENNFYLKSEFNEQILLSDNKDLKAKENKIVNETLKMLNVVTYMLFSTSALVVVMFCLAPLIIVFVIYYKTGDLNVIHPYNVEYWFDVDGANVWPFLYLLQVLATAVVCFNLLGAELLFYILCSYLEMHFRILGIQFANINGEPSRIRRDVIKAAKRHQQLINIVDLGEKLFSRSGLFNMINSSIIICLSAFNITMATDMKTLFAFTTFLTLNLLQVSLMCFFGNKLMESSSQLTTAVYQCPWYDFDANTKKDILIILMRSNKVCKLTAAKFADLNLRAFATILSRSWSYFALLKTVYK